MIHLGMTQDEARAKYQSTGDYEGPLALCGNGNYHAETTRTRADVTCPACLRAMGLFVPGDRVSTPLGAGTVRAFESFDEHGQQAPDTDRDNGGRALVELDDPTRWAAHATHKGPYFFRSEITRA